MKAKKNKRINRLPFYLLGLWAVLLFSGYSFVGYRFFASGTNSVVNFDAHAEGEEFVEIEDESAFDEADEIAIKKEKIVLTAVGDILLTREVARRTNLNGSNIHPFLETAHVLEKADITFGNLETTVFEGNDNGYAGMRFRSDPKMLDGLVFAGFDVLSLANNHTFNYGEEGILKTIEELDKRGFEHCGAGADENEARRANIVEVKGTKVAFLCYNDTDVVPNTSFATESSAGTAELIVENIQSDIEGVLDSADFIILSMHSGIEYRARASKRQETFARAAIDAGADIVLGHHPHVLQQLEHYKGGVILYSLGNFIFDQANYWPNRGVIATFTIDPNDRSFELELIPTVIKSYSQPQIVLDEEEASKIIERIVPKS